MRGEGGSRHLLKTLRSDAVMLRLASKAKIISKKWAGRRTMRLLQEGEGGNLVVFSLCPVHASKGKTFAVLSRDRAVIDNRAS